MRRVALVGAASGIGAECLRLLQAEGAEVVALDIAPVETAQRWIPVDLADPRSVAVAVGRIARPIDALICNAGLPPKGDNGVAVLAVNLLGQIALIKTMLPFMAQGGSITCTTSRAGSAWREHLDEIREVLDLPDQQAIASFLARHGMDATRAYNLSKEALIYWCKTQTEPLLARGLRINSVSPGPVATGILDDFVTAFGAKADKALARVGRAGDPNEVAEAIVFLSGRRSSWINGQDLAADGGLGAMIETDALTT